jgi:DNA polymerase elongation subunit (family B)
MCKSVVSYDANSLYPNTIITLNISPETKIGKIVEISEDEYTIKLSNEKTVTLSKDKFEKLIKKEEPRSNDHLIEIVTKLSGNNVSGENKFTGGISAGTFDFNDDVYSSFLL